MKIYVNGTYRDMTAEEIAALEAAQAEIPEPEPTLEEQIAELKAENKKLKEHSDMLEECIVEIAEQVYQ